MKSLRHLFAAVVVPLLLLAFVTGCSGPTTNTGKTLKSIAVTPASPAHLKVGATQPFTATATFSDGTSSDITGTVTWTSGTTATATISTAGVATGVAAGTTTITATQGSVVSPGVTLTVIALQSIAVTPASPAHLKVGATQQFTATGTFTDSSTADISATVNWASSTTATATISPTGVATGVAAGTTTITATLGSVVSPGVTLTVIALQSIAVTPNPASVAVGATLQFTATGTYTDSSTSDISSLVTWSSLPSSTATISTTGLATGVANGTAQVSAKLGSIVSPGVTLTVGSGGVPVPLAVKIQQINPTIPVGGVEDFTVKFLFSDGSLQAPTAAVTWSSSTTATATILSSVGIASGVAAGTTTIGASSTGLVSDSTTLTVLPAVTRFAFAAGENDIAAASYALNTTASTLTPTGVVRDTTKPVQIVPAPSGQFAYGPGANSPGTIALYTVDAKTGVLKSSGAFPSGVSGLAPLQSIMDPTGRFLYVVNDASPGSVAALATNTTTFDGSLTPITGSPFAVGNFPVGIAEDPAGKYIYVTNNSDGNISAFSVGAGGSLSPLSTPTFSTGSGATSSPGIPAIDPTGSFLYVPNSGDGTISIFSIAPATGLLTAVGSPVSTGAGSLPTMVAITPSNKFLYVTDGAVGHNTIVGFTIGTGGALSGATTGSPYATGNLPQGLAIDINGVSLVVANQNDDSLTYYSIDSTTGKLTAGQTVQTREVPFFVNFLASTAAPTIGPATVEAANAGNATPGTGSVSSYTVNASTGAITTAASSPTTTLDGNDQVATSASGKFFYTASSTGKKLDGFTLDASSAALGGFSTNPTSLGTTVPAGLVAELEDKYVYAADSFGANVTTFNTSSTTGLTPNSTSGPIAGINTIAGDSQGIFLVALGSNLLESAIINQATGAAGNGPITAQAGNWTAGAIDSSGRFLVAADSTGHQISTFAITPVTSSTGTDCITAPFADGCLTLVASSTVAVGASLNGPYAVTFDALGRFVFVADKATGNVAVFTFNSSTGLTTASGSPVLVSAQGISNVAVEANGKFLYVGTKGNGTTTAGTVAVYSINSTTGALTAVGTPVNAGIGTAAVSVTNSVN